MKINRLLLFTSFSGMLLFSCADQKSTQMNTSEGNDRVEGLLAKMTLKEKIGQLNQYAVGEEMTGPGGKEGRAQARYEKLLNGEVGSVLNLLGAENTYKLQKQVVDSSRLGIPLLFAYDVIHGYKTIFPLPLAEAASWDLEAIKASAQVAAKESAASGLHWTFAPMVDVGRDARWGRVMEGAGEDPYLGSLVAKARIEGFQGDDLSSVETIAACAKHFAGYGLVEAGKDYNTVNVGRNTLFNVIMPPFKASVEAGAATFMNAFNDIDGVPSTAHEFILRDVLKKRWEFDGFVISDWNSIGELVHHRVAANSKEAAKLAIIAGSDMDMEADAYIENLEALVNEGAVDEALIDDAARRVLQIKYDLGLFDDPFKYSDTTRESTTILSKEHLDIARDVARKSIVLLKNEKNLLPLKDVTRLGIIGPLAKDKDAPIGNWRGQGESNSAVSLYEGLESALPNVSIDYAEGCKLSIGENNFITELEIEQQDKSGFNEALSVARSSEVVIMALGEPAYMSGEARSRSEIGLPGLQLELLKEVYKVNPNIILVLMNGRPLTITWEAENIPAIVEAWHLGSQAGHAIADVLTGAYNPSGKLPMSFPRNVGQIPIAYNYKSSGRPASDLIFYVHHMDVENSPLYPFGYGLSYTQFEYDNVAIGAPEMNRDGSVIASVKVKNVGDIEGEEVVQLYIHDEVSTVTRPVIELKGFKKIRLGAGEEKTVEFEITKDHLSFYNSELEYLAEPGKFRIFVGGNSAETKEAGFELK